VDQLLRGVPSAGPIHFRGAYGQVVELRALKDYVDDLRSRGVAEWTLERPLPDLQVTGPFIWSGYSLAQITSLLEAVFRQAIPAYADLVETWFRPLSARLQHYQLFPARVEGRVRLPEAPFPGGPSIDVLMEPLPYGRQSEVRFEPGSTTMRDLFEQAERAEALCRELRPSASEWLWPEAYSSVIGEFFMWDAVTDLVYSWLKSDLARVEWLPHAL
jgi:hypothetical protein